MKSMAAILENLNQKTVQEPEKHKPIDQEMYETGKELMRLNQNVEKVMEQYAGYDPKNVKQTKVGSHHQGAKLCGSSTRYQVALAPVRKKPTDLVVYECSQCGVFSAWYVAFNNERNQCVKHMLIGEA